MRSREEESTGLWASDLSIGLSYGFVLDRGVKVFEPLFSDLYVGVLISGDGGSMVPGKWACLHLASVMVVLYPGASSWSFFHQVWDEQLARSAEAWATQCIWAHGPSQLMKYVGQNLSIHSGR